MRWPFAWIGLLCVAFAPARAAQMGAPFAPSATMPDHVVTMVGDRDKKRPYVRTVTHHGDWTAVDDKSQWLNTTRYFSSVGPIAIALSRNPSAGDELAAAVFSRGETHFVTWDYAPHNTGERQTLLGESCTVWNVERTRMLRRGGAPNLARVSCVTDDGIELWSRMINASGAIMSSIEATKVERRPVAPAEVRPARDILALDHWVRVSAAPTDAPASADYELATQLDGRLVRTTRRHGDWRYVDDTTDDVRQRLTIDSQSARFEMTYTAAQPNSSEQLRLARLADEPARRPPRQLAPRDMNRSEQVVGETCEWFAITVVVGYRSQECRASDGIVLKRTSDFQGRRHGGTAVRISRRPLTLDDVMPPPALLDPKKWGLD